MINLRVRDNKIRPVNLRDAYRQEKADMQLVSVVVKATAKKTRPKSRKK